MSLISFDNVDYTTLSTSTVPLPKAVKLICKCKRNLEFDNDDNHNDGEEHANKIQCREENCVKRKTVVSNGNCDDWHPLNGTRYIELLSAGERKGWRCINDYITYLVAFADPTSSVLCRHFYYLNLFTM